MSKVLTFKALQLVVDFRDARGFPRERPSNRLTEKLPRSQKVSPGIMANIGRPLKAFVLLGLVVAFAVIMGNRVERLFLGRMATNLQVNEAKTGLAL